MSEHKMPRDIWIARDNRGQLYWSQPSPAAVQYVRIDTVRDSRRTYSQEEQDADRDEMLKEKF